MEPLRTGGIAKKKKKKNSELPEIIASTIPIQLKCFFFLKLTIHCWHRRRNYPQHDDIKRQHPKYEVKKQKLKIHNYAPSNTTKLYHNENINLWRTSLDIWKRALLHSYLF